MDSNASRTACGARRTRGTSAFFAALFIAALAGAAHAAPLTITVLGVDQAGNQTPVTSYRWTIEEDVTKQSIPGQRANLGNYSFGFHSSYMPVVAAGKMAAGSAVIGADPNSGDPTPVYSALPALDPNKRYFVSVLPDQIPTADGPVGGYQMGSAPVAPGETTVTIYVNKYPVPAAQLSVFVFEDNHPLNGAPDLPEELGLAGFTVELVEAGGTYGMSGGQVTQDAYGKPLGTTYEIDPATGQPYFPPVVKTLGTGLVTTNSLGVALIKNLFPAKYTIHVYPPAGWTQTSTIEGTKGDDAWIKNGEPPFFQEFGPPGHHVFVGFTRSGVLQPTVLNGNKTIKGRVVNVHNSRPPNYAFFNGAPIPACWVGLNETNNGRTLYAAPCDADSNFAIPNVPAGTWELVVWDEPLDVIIASTNITVAASDSIVDLVEVPVFSWFARFEGRVFYDDDQSGFPLDTTTGQPRVGLSDVPINIRFRDGSIYQSTVTSRDANPALAGRFEFPELFPFFNWMIAEVDYARMKATGATIVVDAGGDVPPHNGWTVPSFDRLTPQPQFCMQSDIDAGFPECPAGSLGQPRIGPAGNNLSKTETGPVLLEGMQAFLGETVHIEFGKQAYEFGENGGIAGIVHYAITRAEDDPKLAAAETWEPGIPRVQVNLYLDCDRDGKPDQPDAAHPGQCVAGGLSSAAYVGKLADVDNYPFCWRDNIDLDPVACPGGRQKGPEDVVRSGDGVTFSYGDAFSWFDPADPVNTLTIGVTKTDGWDDAIPTGCQGSPYVIPYGSDAGSALDCFDGLRNFNQVRPAVFDGGYAFGRVAFQPELPNVDYIVEAVAPPGYRHQGNGDKNVVFGDTVSPTPNALPFACAGVDLPVPQYLNLFADQQVDNASYLAGNRTWKKCDMKKVPLRSGQNPAPDFHMFTEAPVAGHGVGFILDDMSSEFDANAPTFGEKHAPPWLPISIRDWTGREIQRVYADEFGSFNFLVPSTYTINPPFPSGVSPNMVVSCMNSPGPIKDPSTGLMVIDPHFDRQYSQFCYTLQYLPGKTTYLDTPVVPVAAFAGPGQFPVDCECEDGTPAIYSVEGKPGTGQSGQPPSFNGPFVRHGSSTNPTNWPTLTIVSGGQRPVPNPYYDPTDPLSSKTIYRNFGFGAAGGTVTLGTRVLPIVSWSDGIVVVQVPDTVPNGPQQLAIKRGDNGKTSKVGLTVTVAGNAARLPRYVMPGQSIQSVIDDVNTLDGDLVIVAPGTYNEYVIMDKKIQLQGWGALSTIINAAKFSSSGLKSWRALMARKTDEQQPATCPTPDPDTGLCPVTAGPNRTFDLLPGQVLGFSPSNNEPVLFPAEEGPGILVVGGNYTLPATQRGAKVHVFTNADNARIDGFSITGADGGGGILASGYARGLEIANNRIFSNYGMYSGGIRIGHTALLNTAAAANDPFGGYTDSLNPNVNVHHNWVAQNGSAEGGAGAGITLGNGSERYLVSRNYVCGNFSMGDGGGIGHLGLSDNGEISDNTIVFNQTFNQSSNVTGAGVFVGGAIPVVAASLSTGSGSVTIARNLMQGNNAGAGEGGGIRLSQVNGADVARRPNAAGQWYAVTMVNNIIVDNVAGYAGGGVSIKDALQLSVVNNTIANNDSTATNMQSFGLDPSESNPQPAGLVSHANSPLLQATIGTGNATVLAIKAKGFSNPTLQNNIVWHNRSFYWKVDANALDPQTGQPVYGLYDPIANTPAGTTPVYRDLAVLDTASQGTFAGRYIDTPDKLNPTYSILTDVTGYLGANNQPSDPLFVASYVNGNRKQSLIVPGVTTTIDTSVTFDEGGNFIDIRYGPLTRRNCLVAGCPLFGDYHLTAASPARGSGRGAGAPPDDFDGDARPSPPDVGADQLVVPLADLSITVNDGVANVAQGAAITYTIVVSNAGPSAATGATVNDTVPASLNAVTWTCVAAAGASCGAASGSGAIATTVNLAAGSSATFTMSGTVSPSATGTLSNTATVAAPASVTDPNTANNSASDTDTIVAAVAFPALAVLDNFNRANANTLGANWRQLTLLGQASIRVNANQAFALLPGEAIWNVPSGGFAAKQGAAMTFVAGGGSLNASSLLLKATGGAVDNPASFIRVRYNGGQVIVETTTNGNTLTPSYTQRGTLVATFAGNDTMTAVANTDGSVDVWKNAAYVGRVTGTTFTGTGRIGIQLPLLVRVDNFSGGTVP